MLPLVLVSLSTPYAWAENNTAVATTNAAETPSAAISTPVAPNSPSQVSSNQSTWLGVSLATVSVALSAQLNDLIPAGQGVLVQNVIPNSPAAKAGIQNNDVLLNYGNQKLYSPSQLAGLIKAAQAGNQAEIQLVSHGQLKTINVTLEAQPQTRQASQGNPFWQSMPSSRLAPSTAQGQTNNTTAWDSFESVQVKTLANGNYHAEVSYKDKNNETKKFTFEGKKEEIVDQIQKQKDLPKDKQQALLNALNMRPSQTFQSLFNSPMFQRDPLNDPFFNNMIPQNMMPSFEHFFQHPPVNRGNAPLIPQKGGVSL